MKLVATSIVSALLLMPMAAKALNGFGYYGLGQQFNHFDGVGFEQVVDLTSLTEHQFKQDKTGIGYRLFAGYQFNQHVALELGFGELGDSDFYLKHNTTGVKELTGKSRTSVIDLRLTGTYQISRNAFFLASVGAYSWDNSYSQINANTSTFATTKISDKKQSALVALGWGYAFNPKHAIRVELEATKVAEANTTNMVFSYMTKF